MSASIGVVGGGIAGLSSAFRLAQQGHQVTIFESSDTLGGLGTFFELDGKYIDRFYHCIMPSDSGLLRLIEDAGLSDSLYWKDTSMGMIYENAYCPFNSPVDLLKFSALSIFERLRLGAGSLILPRIGRDEELDEMPIRDFLTRIFGQRLWEKFWSPMFAAKFGEGASSLPALYLTKRLGRESNAARRGYIEGGLHGLIMRLEKLFLEAGGRVEMGSEVQKIEWQSDGMASITANGVEHRFDCVITTLPLTTLKKTISAPTFLDNLDGLNYQGVVNTLFLLDKPLDGHYWTPVLFSKTPFDGVVESSALIRAENYGGLNAAYVMKYTERTSELFQKSDDEIADQWEADFLRIYADRGIKKSNIKHRFVFRAPFVEPIYPLGYLKMVPPDRIPSSPIFLATTAQVYPNITSWNSSINIAGQTTSQVEKYLEQRE